MNLYEIATQYRDDVARLQDLDLPSEVVLDTLEGMQGDVTDKIRASMIVSMNLDAEADALEMHGKRMLDAAKARRNRSEFVRTNALLTIQGCGIVTPIKYAEFTIGMQKNPASCEVLDVQELPADLKACSVTFTVRPDKANEFMAAIQKNAKLAAAIAGMPDIDIRPDKKAILDVLKKAGTDTLPGARLCPPQVPPDHPLKASAPSPLTSP